MQVMILHAGGLCNLFFSFSKTAQYIQNLSVDQIVKSHIDMSTRSADSNKTVH